MLIHVDYLHRTLLVNNIGRGPKADENVIGDYEDLSEDESRAWLLPSSGDHEFAGKCLVKVTSHHFVFQISLFPHLLIFFAYLETPPMYKHIHKISPVELTY